MYVLRTGCQWKALPRERFGSASAVHKRFLQSERAGFFEAPWQAGLAEYDEMAGIAWRWQSIDGAWTNAPLARQAVGPNPTDRGKKESKRHLLVDGRGVPLSIIVTAVNVNDGKRLDAVLGTIAVKRPCSPQRRSKHLCADAGYRSVENFAIIDRHGYVAHVVGRNQQVRRDPGRRLAAGWSRSATAGSTASANCSCATRNSSAAFSRSLTLRPPSSPSARCR